MTIECRRYIESARNIQLPIARIQALASCISVIREMSDSEAEELVNSLIREAIQEHNRNLKDMVFDD
jgi:hypothetical protein